jgi:hypothetical protein
MVLYFVRHQQFEPRVVGKAELRGSEAWAVATKSPSGSEVDGISLPYIVPVRDRMSHVVKRNALYGTRGHS